MTSSGNICVEYDVYQTSSASLSPSFTYSNQCSSALLTSYIPVLIVGRTIHITFCFASPYILILIQKLIDVKKIVRIGIVSGIIWPELFLGNTKA